jgi:hypothetical protein
MEGSRRVYTNTRIRQLKSVNDLKKLIEIIVAPKEFFGLGISQTDAVTHINSYLRSDGYEVRYDGESYKLFSGTTKIVEHRTVSTLSREFITEQVEKCKEKLDSGDYDGAITNARSLIEAISIKLIETKDMRPYESNGDLVKIFKDMKKSLNMSVDKDQYPQYLIEIIQGLSTSVQGIAGLSNRGSDRHNRTYKPQKHHAKLAVNSALTFCEFMVDSFYYQQDKGA